MSDARRTIKCVVWDLDGTLWDGTLVEGDRLALRPGVLEILRALDERGILHSIASKNAHDDAAAALERLGVLDYFLCPQIGWSAKSASVRRIAETLNLGIEALAFVDDEPFERDEVASELPGVMLLAAADVTTIASMPEMMPRFVTEDSRRRRSMYRADTVRKEIEDAFVGPKEELLASLGMRMTIADAGPDDLARAEELTVRTNQLNATGVTYSHEELDAFRTSGDHLLLIAELEDRYGAYGKIGLALVETVADRWTLKLLLTSCRVMSRGVGTILLGHVMRCAKDRGVGLRADFVPTGRNRLMHVTYKLAGFREVGRREPDVVVLESDLAAVPAPPGSVEIVVTSRLG